MKHEIERKYLVIGEFQSHQKAQKKIKQGYLSSDPERTVRIRVSNTNGFITIKGASDHSGMKRLEWEKEIPVQEAETLLKLCLPTVIHKTRYLVDYKGNIFEVDVFHDANKGLILAEIELESIEQKFELPDWIGEEVTQDKKYYNSFLSKHPYTTW